MIKPAEIQKIAREAGVRDTQIEKDYILSWILKGIAQHEQLLKTLVFKGGTVLKKFYFEDYRFSEDLDFTLRDTSLSQEQIFNWFNDAFIYIKEEANIPLTINDTEDNQDRGGQEETGINFYIQYTGPLGGQGSKKRVKVDISKSELMVFAPIMKAAFLGYSDLEEYELWCYSLEEVLVEKMRSVMQRMQARDFYDIWYLLEEHGMDPDFYTSEFSTKCAFKKLKASDFHRKLEDRLPQYKGRWQNSMGDQIRDLPDFVRVERETLRHLKKLKV